MAGLIFSGLRTRNIDGTERREIYINNILVTPDNPVVPFELFDDKTCYTYFDWGPHFNNNWRGQWRLANLFCCAMKISDSIAMGDLVTSVIKKLDDCWTLTEEDIIAAIVAETLMPEARRYHNHV